MILLARQHNAAMRVLLSLLVLFGLACAFDEQRPSGQETDSCVCPQDAPVVDLALLAFLSKARAVHGRTDIAERGGHPERAIAILEELVKARMPSGPPPEVREVLADTLARLAELRSAGGDFDGASRDVKRGLKLARERTHYRGRLMEVLGVVEKRRYEKLLADGNEAQAQAAKARSIKAFQNAIAIQDAVIREALAGAGSLDGGTGGR